MSNDPNSNFYILTGTSLQKKGSICQGIPAYKSLRPLKDPLALENFLLETEKSPTQEGIVILNDLLSVAIQILATFHANIQMVPSLAIGLSGYDKKVCGVSFGLPLLDTIVQRMLTGSLSGIFDGYVLLNSPLTREAAFELIHHKMPGEKVRPLRGVVAPSFDLASIELIGEALKDQCWLASNPALAKLGKEHFLKTLKGLESVRGGFFVESGEKTIFDFKKNKFSGFVAESFPNHESEALLAIALCEIFPEKTILITSRGRLIESFAKHRLEKICGKSYTNFQGASIASNAPFSSEEIRLLIEAGAEVIISPAQDDDREVRLSAELCKEANKTLLLLKKEV